MILSTCPNALRAAGGRPWLPVCSSLARSFSSSPVHRGKTIITFGETSSPELSEILNSFREKVILPTYLAGEQRKKIYKPKLKAILQNDPVTMEIDGVLHKFGYINKVEDLPNTNKTVMRALNLMKTPADFQNLVPLFEGLERANRKVKSAIWTKAIRRASANGALPVILECVRNPGRTNFRLNGHEKVMELLTVLQYPAIKSRFDEAKTKTALRQIQLVLNLMESNELHWNKRGDLAFPLHRDPQALAARLHMAAARAAYHQGGKDVDGKVTSFAEQLVSLWPENAGLLDLQSDEAFKDRERMRYLLHRNAYLWYASPVLNGLNLATQLVDPGLAMQLQNRADAVDNEVKTALASVVKAPGKKGEHMYNMLFNPDAESAEADLAKEDTP
ncbi:hypothetical protein VTI74DRAFT_4350 [Chaetomium olivicolor]